MQILAESKNECPDSFVPIRLNSNTSIPLLPFYPDIFNFKDGIAGRAITLVAAGSYHTFMLMDDGSLFGWGDNQYGQLGTGDQRRRVAPTLINYFGAQLSKPFAGPLDGVGRSIKQAPTPELLHARPVSTIAAGMHHTIVATECSGGGFRNDGSCNCRFGWKGPDCSIECKGGSNNSCSKHGTFDTIYHVGDRATCSAYLVSVKATSCVGLKLPHTPSSELVRIPILTGKNCDGNHKTYHTGTSVNVQ